MKRGEKMKNNEGKKNTEAKKSPLLDAYIQKKNQEAKFDGMEEEEIAKAIRTLIQKDDTLPENLN